MPSLLERLPSGSRIAVIRLRSLGDCVLTTPALALLKAASARSARGGGGGGSHSARFSRAIPMLTKSCPALERSCDGARGWR